MRRRCSPSRRWTGRAATSAGRSRCCPPPHLGVAEALTEERPADDEKPFAGKRWARADAICRGHILAALSDRLLPVYAPHATAAAVARRGAHLRPDLTAEVQGEKAKAFRYAEASP
ncbi:hypothetical protein ZWY2020_017929 [Hordeum vulgare]|nr:hypothetical protein ZWY2020_017929 [Hordeum vulgare]